MNNIHFIKTEKTAVVTSLGNSNAPETIWLILHGYGQLVENFQRDFQIFDLNKNYFVFPNALNHFYIKGGKGDVGASWMTKYFRENDINDNNQYLDKVYQTFIQPHLKGKTNFYTLGFSQGAASLVRWLSMQNIQPDNIILWGAVFPPDIEKDIYLQRLKQLNWYYIIGNQDEFISLEERKKQKLFFEQNAFKLQWIEYSGGHFLQSSLLKNIFRI